MRSATAGTSSGARSVVIVAIAFASSVQVSVKARNHCPARIGLTRRSPANSIQNAGSGASRWAIRSASSAAAGGCAIDCVSFTAFVTPGASAAMRGRGPWR